LPRYASKPANSIGPEYAPELRQAQNLTVYLYNALRFDVSENNTEVRQLGVGVLSDGHFKVSAGTYVLATGGHQLVLKHSFAFLDAIVKCGRHRACRIGHLALGPRASRATNELAPLLLMSTMRAASMRGFGGSTPNRVGGLPLPPELAGGLQVYAATPTAHHVA
jgi:hypothetical protein